MTVNSINSDYNGSVANDLSLNSSILITNKLFVIAANMTSTIKPSITLQSTKHSNQSQLFVLNVPPTNFFGINDRDVPILIGAAAGAIGLIVIILSAILAWYCCQYGLRRQRSVYCLDDENEKWSTGSKMGSGLFNDNESVVFMGIDSLSGQTGKGFNIKRSLSAPLQAVNADCDKQRFEAMIALDLGKPIIEDRYGFESLTEGNLGNNIKSAIVEPGHVNLNDGEEDDDDDDNLGDDKSRYTSKSQLYSEVNNECEAISSRTRSLPWKKNSAEADDLAKNTNPQNKINFSKKRKNRMRNDSAAAIALNRSGASPSQLPFLSKETDSLVDNDSLIAGSAVVVYDERTVL